VECNELTVREQGGVKEYICGEVSLARLITTGNGTRVLSIDVVSTWDMPIDESVRVGNVQLIYRRDVVNNARWEFVGYDDGTNRELISIRVFLEGELSDDAIKELIINVVKTYSRNK
jgi:hypothetical protein